MSDFSFVANAHPSFIDSMYQKYQQDPESVEEGWRTFFSGFDFAHSTNGSSTTNGRASNGHAALGTEQIAKEFGVQSIIHGFRDRGHLLSTTNPIRDRRDRRPHLDLVDYSLEESDLTRSFLAGEEIGMPGATLQEIINRMRAIYCGNIGFEYSHIEHREKRMWLREKIERRADLSDYGLSTAQKRRILEKLNGAVVFENFLHTKYIGQKRFSLEGGETTIAALDAIINKGADGGVEEFVIGMAHRGRLNVLVNVMGKTYEHVFNEFEGHSIPDLSLGDGDVKYHLGYSSLIDTSSGKKVHLKLVPNPSHLESVDPVVEGFARAKADILYDSDYDRILPILIHGDAALAGQGVVYETVQMSQLEGYYTGGTIHFVINNQVGFTTDFDDARSSTYSTGVASLVQAPVFHVNGDDPDAVIFAVELATEYRQKFNNDVFIDMVCYRRHGHNEGDDPKFTQPEMYKLIDQHPDTRKIYVKKLLEAGDMEKEIAEQLEKRFWNDLQNRLDAVKQKPLPYQYQKPEQEWRKLNKQSKAEDFDHSPPTGISRQRVDQIIDHLMRFPQDFNPLGKLNRLLKGKRKLLDKGQLDWAMAELLAYGSVLTDGKDVRMSGQDVKRGTFSHRHAIVRDDKTFAEYNRLNDIQPEQGQYRVFNSLLSEFGVLGFEYGYSLASPNTLVVWEAQFGDFYNGAQTIVDQYISAGESKWQRMSGLVMLLPHGYEGQGPEHSSARLERFLQLCGNYNMTVANITTPANFFHAIRRQLARPFRKPLIIMSPKSLLRHPLCVSDLEAFEDKPENTFHEYYDDAEVTNAKKVKTALFCTGKIYYDLLMKKQTDQRDDVAIIRLEQLYPFPQKQVDQLLKKYAKAQMRWVQEESANMGSWQFLLSHYPGDTFQLISRTTSASPSTGYKKVHDQQQQDLVDRAFA
ncbi:MAG: 2-oxoglutarate dehydrogenase E1 component [Bacteroidota bacterium]